MRDSTVSVPAPLHQEGAFFLPNSENVLRLKKHLQHGT
jgi:hypothetical protein